MRKIKTPNTTERAVIMRGLPASGKTSFALDLIDKNPGVYTLITRDDIRANFVKTKYSKPTEEYVRQISKALISTAVIHGKVPIICDTNLEKTTFNDLIFHLKQLSLTSDEITIYDFLDVPLQECIDRDTKRENSVGRDVIIRLHSRAIKNGLLPDPNNPVFEVLGSNPNGKPAMLFDIDGTVALMNGRGPHELQKIHTDLPNWPIITVAQALQEQNCHIVFMSGRENTDSNLPTSCYNRTYEWLEQYFAYDFTLFLRKEKDFRKDSVIKYEIYRDFVFPQFNIQAVFDDRNQVVDMWREIGLTCLQVAPGDF